MAVSVYDYALSEASNSTTGGWNTAEGQDPATVNDGMRAHKQNVAGYLDDEGAVNTVAGTGDAITVTMAQPFTAYGTAAGQIMTGVQIRFIAPGTNTGAATLNVNSIGTKKLRKTTAGVEGALAAGDVVSGETYFAIYRSTADTGTGAWIIVGAAASTAAATTSASGIVELATQTEASTLADTTRAITSDGLFFLGGYTTTATAAGTTTLTVTSNFRQVFTGSSTQTVVLPVTSTLVLGRPYRVINNSTGAVTVQSSGANTILVIPPGEVAEFVCILTSGTTAASWDAKFVRGGLELLTSGSVSAAATLDIVLTAYTAYRGLVFELINFIPATDAVDLWTRLSTDGGATYDAGAGAYFYSGFLADSSGTGTLSSTTDTKIAIGTSIGNGAAEGASCEVRLMGQTSTAVKPRISHFVNEYRSNDVSLVVTGSGVRNAAQDTDAIRFLFSSGNITSGTYAVYGYV